MPVISGISVEAKLACLQQHDTGISVEAKLEEESKRVKSKNNQTLRLLPAPGYHPEEDV